MLQRLVDDQYFLDSLFEEGCEDEIVRQIKRDLICERHITETHFIVCLLLHEKPLYVY